LQLLLSLEILHHLLSTAIPSPVALPAYMKVEDYPSPVQVGTTPNFGLAVKRSGSLAFYFRPVPLHCQFLLKHHTIQAQLPFQG